MEDPYADLASQAAAAASSKVTQADHWRVTSPSGNQATSVKTRDAAPAKRKMPTRLMVVIRSPPTERSRSSVGVEPEGTAELEPYPPD